MGVNVIERVLLGALSATNMLQLHLSHRFYHRSNSVLGAWQEDYAASKGTGAATEGDEGEREGEGKGEGSGGTAEASADEVKEDAMDREGGGPPAPCRGRARAARAARASRGTCTAGR